MRKFLSYFGVLMLVLSSCRNVDFRENAIGDIEKNNINSAYVNVDENSVSLLVDVLGAKFGENIISKTPDEKDSSSNMERNSLIAKELELENEITQSDDNLHVDVQEITEEIHEKELNLTSNTIKNLSSKTTSYLNNGAAYRMILFDSEGKYLKHVDNTVGKPTKPLMISRGRTYSIVIFSFNSWYLPYFSGISKINDYFPYTDTSYTKEFVYKRIDNYKTDKHKNTLKITLIHKKPQVKIKLDLTGLKTYNNEEPIARNAILEGINVTEGNVYISDGKLRNPKSKKDVRVTLSRKGKNIYESGFIPVNVYIWEDGYFKVDIKARAKHGYQEKTISSHEILVNGGKRTTFNIKVTGTSVPAPKCEDPEATNTGQPLPCKYPPKCEDPEATNTGQPLPCKYPPKCEDPNATNTGQPLPCKYPPKCEDPNATNTGQPLPCKYPPKPKVRFLSSVPRVVIGYRPECVAEDNRPPDYHTEEIRVRFVIDNDYSGWLFAAGTLSAIIEDRSRFGSLGYCMNAYVKQIRGKTWELVFHPRCPCGVEGTLRPSVEFYNPKTEESLYFYGDRFEFKIRPYK